MSDIIETATLAAREAGQHLMSCFGSTYTIREKADRTFVTDADTAAERIVIDHIRGRFPTHGVLGEEQGLIGGSSDYLWVVDPLDGTHNFMRGVRIFGVCIGIVYHSEYVGGVIYMPCDDECYVAEKGCGATKNGVRIAVSQKQRLAECSVSFDSVFRDDVEIRCEALRRLASTCFNMRMYGASSRILSYIAEGKLDVAVEFDDKPWDFAAGACLVQEAGGVITRQDGGPLTLEQSGYIAGNQRLHDEAVALVRGIDA